jgi:3-dehydroquinate dehydratase/shikimate dehydrogenase
MICVSVATESRRMAMADMLTAARQADLLEVRLDRFGKAPDFHDLLAARRKPVILTCRRPRDGGEWQGSEDERLALLRQCVVHKADYVEIELDVADQVRPFPGAKRVISFTDLNETPADLGERYDEARAKNPDVIKLTTRARTPEAAWPLVQILARSSVPTVAVGLGPSGVMLAVLGKKLGAPWAYAALGRGLESYPGQPTVEDLEAVYHYRAIERSTRLIGVTGFDERARYAAAGLNAGLAHRNLPVRCWPVAMGDPGLFRKIIQAVKLAGVVIDDAHQAAALAMATDYGPGAAEAQAADLLQPQAAGWRAYYTAGAAAVAALEAALAARAAGGRPLQDRIVMVVGTGGLARAVARGVQARGANPVLAGHERERTRYVAEQLGCRYVLREAMYSTLHDVLVVCPEEPGRGARPGTDGVHPGYLRPGMTVLDLTAVLAASPLLREADARGCTTVPPHQLFVQGLREQFQLLTGEEVPPEVLLEALTRCAGGDELGR